LKLDSMLEALATLLEHGVETLGLGNCARESVENEAVACIKIHS
jgi:hypothetical protein